jgi:hypothetical protein
MLITATTDQLSMAYMSLKTHYHDSLHEARRRGSLCTTMIDNQ